MIRSRRVTLRSRSALRAPFAAAAAWGLLAAAASAELRLTVPPALGVERTVEATAETIGTEAVALRILLDGVERARGAAPRLTAPVPLAWPPRPQRLEAEALDATGCPLEVAARFLRHPERSFPVALRLAGAGCDESGPWAWVFARPPAGAEISRIRLFAGARDAGKAVSAPAAFRLSGRELAAPFLRVEVESRGAGHATAELLLGVTGPGERIEVRRAELRRILPAPGPLSRREDLAAARVRVDGVLQRLVSAERGEALPIELGVALDDSLSMLPLREAALELAAEAGRELAGRAGSRVFLARFTEEARIVAVAAPSEPPPPPQLDGEAAPLGATALFDALLAALHEFDAGGARAALFALTDGCDTASRGGADEVAALATVKGIPIYPLLFDGEPCRIRLPPTRPGDVGAVETERGRGRSRTALERLARASGGRLVRVSGRDDLATTWRRILADLDRQALFVFEPSGPEIDAARAEVTFSPPRR